MSISGIANPGPPILKIRRAGKPGHNLSGHMLKPKANSRRVRVTDLGTNAIIGYFDIETDTGRILLPERVCIELLKIASKTKRKIEAVREVPSKVPRSSRPVRGWQLSRHRRASQPVHDHA